MKTKIIVLLVCFLLALDYFYGQQPSPIGILFNPRVNTFVISGVGGGNLNELTTPEGSTSGQVAFDWNIGLADGLTKKSKKEKHSTLTTLFRYNILLQSNYLSCDSIEMRKLVFVDNKFQMLLGLRLSNIREFSTDNNSKLLNLLFLDASMAPYKLERSFDLLNTGFRSFNINGGYQFGYITNTDFGLVGFMISPQINYLFVYDNESNGTSFEIFNNAVAKLSRNILGGGFKINIPLNDFYFFFEARKYFPLNNSSNIIGLTDRAIFSFGGIATGTVFKTRTKEVKYTLF